MEATKLSPQELARVIEYVATRRALIRTAIHALKEVSHSTTDMDGLELNGQIYATVNKLEEEDTRLIRMQTEQVNAQYC